MSKILRQLYEGEIFPAEQFRPKLKEYLAIRKRNATHYDHFIQKLENPLLVDEFRKIMDEQLDLCPLELTESFLDGFRLGARLAIELFEEQ